MYRQGDVLIELTEEDFLISDSELIAREDGRIILAHGEATGHAHAINSMDANMYIINNKPNLYLVVNNDVKITHEEHSFIPVPPGKYKVTRQIQYTPEKIMPVYD